MSDNKYESLKLENQLCFPIYAAARQTIKSYTPYLDKLDLTYTQYITMMVLWDKGTLSVRELGEILFLDSGTLTPLLKKLEAKGLITRARSFQDERVLKVSVTDEGMAMREKALIVPEEMAKCVLLDHDEVLELYRLLYKLLGKIES